MQHPPLVLPPGAVTWLVFLDEPCLALVPSPSETTQEGLAVFCAAPAAQDFLRPGESVACGLVPTWPRLDQRPPVRSTWPISCLERRGGRLGFEKHQPADDRALHPSACTDHARVRITPPRRKRTSPPG